MSRDPLTLLAVSMYFFGGVVVPFSVMAESDWTRTEGLYFREDTADIPDSEDQGLASTRCVYVPPTACLGT